MYVAVKEEIEEKISKNKKGSLIETPPSVGIQDFVKIVGELVESFEGVSFEKKTKYHLIDGWSKFFSI